MKTTIKTSLAALLLLGISCTKETLHTPSAAGAQTQDNSTLQTTGHYIGERFGGGIIFYICSTGTHGLIADTVDLGTFAWWNGSFSTTGATGTALFTGKANTRKIISSQGRPGSYAALKCANSKRSGYTDWYLPSIDELNELYKQKNVVGGFADDYYWSSSEDYYYYAWTLPFHSGSDSNDGKGAFNYVRAVRAF